MRHFPRALLPLLAAGAKVSLRIGDFSSEEADGDKALGDEAIMTGTDDTSERAVAYYGDIVFRKAGS